MLILIRSQKYLYNTKVHLGIPPLIDGDSIYCNDKEKANVLNNHFQTKSELPENHLLPKLPPIELKTNSTLENINFSEIEIEKVLQTWEVKRSRYYKQ